MAGTDGTRRAAAASALMMTAEDLGENACSAGEGDVDDTCADGRGELPMMLEAVAADCTIGGELARLTNAQPPAPVGPVPVGEPRSVTVSLF